MNFALDWAIENARRDLASTLRTIRKKACEERVARGLPP